MEPGVFLALLAAVEVVDVVVVVVDGDESDLVSNAVELVSSDLSALSLAVESAAPSSSGLVSVDAITFLFTPGVPSVKKTFDDNFKNGSSLICCQEP
ncbi:hypothetical protein WICPIJ_007747 [Wickerhamomyces pijperi]|uniref:Secreted protein n=1 Tax=Wickerhamomyces pijperi TaxID=599730 RepID=A0A9P8TJM1_WICPI|nr:hypothetical protein WICPIJ_007747 [Wickerhamomyces pijperi]